MTAFTPTKETGIYNAQPTVTAGEILTFAQKLIKQRYKRGTKITRSTDAADLFMHHFQDLEHEVVAALFLNSKNRVIAFEILFHGSIRSSYVHPREVIKRALHHNAGAMILAHNHPSGDPHPSHADTEMTIQLKKALEMIDVVLVDHIVIGGCDFVSYVSMGLL